MLEGKAVIGETDMLQTMQRDALDLASKALDSFDVTEATEIARFIKKEFDRTYGPGWQCIVEAKTSMFTEEELSNFLGVVGVTPEHIEIDCGCTNPRYGDTPGKLRVYFDGRLEIDCDCYDDCPKAALSPLEFARHAGRTNVHNNWKSQIWVFQQDGHKLPLWRTCLLKHHAQVFHRPLRQIIHRDEFLHCSRCNKDRRVVLRNREACRTYHKAVRNNNWTCSDMTGQPMKCNDDEERACRKLRRGCPRAAACGGCEQCVCLGCDMCRFEECTCRECVEYILNM